MLSRLPKLYAITDQELSGLSHLQQVERLAEGGTQLIQLRDKQSSARDFYRGAAEAVQVARRLGVVIIINDRVDIALALRADGVHLGQKDMPAEAARSLLGREAIIGVSTHSVGEAAEAVNLPIDYLALGPIFSTSSKNDSEPVVGLKGLHEVRQTIGQKPLVAIGGITLRNAVDVVRAGADSVAMIGGLVADGENITARVQALIAALKSQ